MSSITNINGHLVIGKLQVPVRNVTNYILSRYSLESIIQRLPINKQEVFECLDAIADHDSIQVNDRLVVVNQSTVEEDILLVTTNISDNIFLKILQFGHLFNTSIEDLNDLFDIGFRQLAIESFQDKVSGNGVLDESSDIHGIVSSAIEDAIPDLSIDKILTYLKNDT
jgi:uncharacterized protein (DUF433 family)